MSFVGKPNYGGGKRKQFKLKDGDNIYRILPPCGSFADDGTWHKYESVHWGYKGSNTWSRVFRCPLVAKGKGTERVIIKPCAECDLIAERKLAYDKRLKELTEGQGIPMPQAKEQLKPLGDWLFSHNRDSKVYLNVQTPTGEIGRLAIPHKSFLALQLAVGEVLKKGKDPVGAAGGVYFNFNRTGSNRETLHRVSVVMEEFSPPGSMEKYERIKDAPLTAETLARMEKEAYDLGDMFRNVTSDDVARLVASGGEASVVDSIFSAPESKTDVSTPGVGGSVGTFFVESESDEDPTEDELTMPAVVVARAPAPTPAPAAVDDVDAQIAALMAMKAKKATELQLGGTSNLPIPPVPQKTEATKAAPAAKTSPATMSNDEFLKQFGAGKL